ncbi:MAG: uroporphyrinogen-III C-methyltransferase [Chitinophagaceae bacterium]
MGLKGKVYLAGAGPGDPELVTLKTIRCLQKADIILVDRLVNQDIIASYANPGASVIKVGKQSGKSGSVSQSEINALIVEYARQYDVVVRLKGGDVSVFSNILDELETLISHSIDYEIIPGITAALGASAFAGIPLTARGYASGLRMLTYHDENAFTTAQWFDLGNTSDTLVFYMASKKLNELTTYLILNGMNKDLPVAIIEQATTPFQKVFISSLSDCSDNEKKYLSPSLVIIGKVVELHEKYNWFRANSKNVLFFDPVSDKSVIHNQENVGNAS